MGMAFRPDFPPELPRRSGCWPVPPAGLCIEPNGACRVGYAEDEDMDRRDIIAIGGSTGAVEALKHLCGNLPADLAATLFIVVHVGNRGNDLLAGVLNASSPLAITTAVDGEVVKPSHAYVAPADRHLLVIDNVLRLG